MTDNGTKAEGRFLGLERAEWWFWLAWVLSSAVGWSAGWVMGKVQIAIGAAAIANAAAAAMCGPMRRAVAGAGQWLILRKRPQRSGLWVSAIVAGWILGLVVVAVGWVVVMVAVSAGGSPGILYRVLMAVAGAGAGAVTSIVQWLALRQRVQRAGWWVLVNAADWAVGWAVGYDRIVVRGVDVRPAALAVTGVVCGAIAGFVLISLLRRPEAMPPEEA